MTDINFLEMTLSYVEFRWVKTVHCTSCTISMTNVNFTEEINLMHTIILRDLAATKSQRETSKNIKIMCSTVVSLW
jgi:hypothetical protein